MTKNKEVLYNLVVSLGLWLSGRTSNVPGNTVRACR